MEWYVVQSQNFHGLFSSLGSPVGNEYQVGENCLASLGEILTFLATEDRTMRNFRRALGIAQVIQTDLIPLLIHAKDDKKIMDATVRVLVSLTLPVECLLPMDSLSQTECGRQTISDLNRLLLSAKQAFIDPRSTLCLVQIMRAAIDKGGKLMPEECESIGNCLLLLRNILHIPENKGSKLNIFSKPCLSPLDSNGSGNMSGSSKQNLILWNLFAQNVDKVILHLMTCPQRAEWDVPMVQLVALTFKDQHMASLLKMLHLWLEASLNSESSEDNESNTSPQPLNQGSGNSSPVHTSEATSDSSDNGGGATKGGKMPLKGDRSKGFPVEGESGGSMARSWTGEPPNSKQKDHLSGRPSCQSCSSNKEKYTLGSEDKVEEKKKEVQEDEGRGKVEEEVGKGRVGEQEDGAYGDTDSGVFSQTTSHYQQSTVEKKIHSHPHRRHHHHQQHAHRYPHHHRAHAFQHPNGKKDLAAAQPMTTPPCKGMTTTTSELSDCGYSTQVENQPESLSTSSNKDEGPIAKRSMKPGHQKHHTMRQHHKVDSNCLGNVANSVHPAKVQKSGCDLRRKRLVKRARIHIANVKALMHHIPTDDDISNLLKEFTLDFLLQGYGLLVSGLHIKLLSSCTHRAPGIRTSDPPSIILSNASLLSRPTTILRTPSSELPPSPIDTSHFFWLITFFLRFSSQLELEFEHISMVLSYDILSYLVFEGVGLCEEVELALHHCRKSDIKPCLRRLHLVVTAIREFVQAVESYGKMAVTIPGREGDRAHLQMLQKQMAATRDLRSLFVLLLQHYDPSVMSKQYLQDVVVTNHVLLLFLESGGGINDTNSDKAGKNGMRRNSLIGELEMMEHITHFANGSIVQQYGHLLEAFQENGEFVNDCVFTMLHHIGGGEVNRAETLFQPTLLRTFSAMWEADFDMCDDWSDLIEYIIYKFISNPQQGMNQKNVGTGKSQLSLPVTETLPVAEEKKDEIGGHNWTMEEIRNLRWFYAQSCKDKNVLGKIVKLYRQKSGVVKSLKEVLNQLLSQEIINSSQYSTLKNTEIPGDIMACNVNSPYSPTTAVNLTQPEKFDDIETCKSNEPEDIAKLAVHLVEEGLEREVNWLQDALLEACYVKLYMRRQREEGFSHDCPQFPVMEPVPYHYALMGQPIPIVPWGVEEQCAVIKNSSFIHLLHLLGIQKPREDGIGGIYPRIPTSFTPLDLLEAARKLGELTLGHINFDPAELKPLGMGVGGEGENGGGRRMPPPLSPPSTSPSCFEQHNSSPRDRLSPQPTSSGSQKNSSEMNIMGTLSSNINWLNIVARSKSPALINTKQSLKKEGNTKKEEEVSSEKKQKSSTSKENC